MASLPDPPGDAAVLAGRTVLVTGASSGIGLAVARRARRAGARVFVSARNEDRLRRAAAEIDAIAAPCDVADATSVHRLAAYVDEALDGAGPDVVVSAAGAFELAPVAETDPSSFDRHLAVNLRGVFLVIRAFLPRMLERGSGHLISIGSIAGRLAFPHNGAYSASKFGLRGLHGVLDAELRGTGVRATLVEPAATDTPLWDGIDRDRHPALPPREGMLSAEAVADAVLYAATRPADVDLRNLILDRT